VLHARAGSPRHRVEEAAGVGDAWSAAGRLGQEGGEGRSQGARSLGRVGTLAEDGLQGRLAAVGAERGLTLDGKEQDRPQGPEVGGRARGVASDLFGGEERDHGPVGIGGGAEGGQAEPGQADVAVGGDQDVDRAEVEVGQTGGVGRLQGVQELQAELGRPADGEGAVPGHELVEGQGVDQLAGHVDEAVLHDHVVEADQGGMVQRGRGPGLGGHPVPQGGLVGVARVGVGREAELLHGQRPAVGVGGLPDHAGRAAAQRGVQRPAAGDEPLGGVV
jgi:hypothetical protein